MSWAHYLLQVNIYLIIFYCFYKLLLDKETYFVLNRIYLVSSGLFSLAIPFLRFELFSQKVVSDKLYISVSEINTVVNNYAILPQTQEQYDWGRLIVIIYIIGVLIYLLYFVYQLFAINTLFSRANANDAFSFFQRKSVAENLPERATVDLHEDIHVKQLHTIDVLFFEILAIITWFNPVIYFYKKSIKNIHEYLADEAAAKFQGDKETYALLLLSQAFGVKPNTLMNGFFTKSLIKKRIFMLHKQRSKKTAILKYGLFVPLFALTLVLSSATIRKNNQILAVADQIPLNDASSVVNQAIKAPLSVVNLAPALKLDQVEVQDLVTKSTVISPSNKDGDLEKENTNSWNNFYKFLGDGIKYPADAVKKKIQGNLVVNFAISRGKVTDLVVQDELGGGCDEEVIQQISNYDDFFQKDGNYCLKVTFKLEGADSQFKNEEVTLPEGYRVLQGMLITGFAPKEETVDNRVYNFVAMENPPSYPGGVGAFYKFLANNIKYPLLASDNEIQGTVYVSFTVEKDGSLNDIKVDRKLGYGTDEEAVRVLKLSKRWNPGMQNGRVVRVKYNIPIKFSFASEKQQVNSTILFKNYSNDKTPPLIVLDGELKDGVLLKDLDPKTIAEISVLKGASATALYGKSGENGAILITSKKQKSGSITATLINKN
ncbi:TonB family protein [Pedobacter sp. UC225_61]|uniref:TonB family protein n=1 Tax=Pedobacter sp. UC225_61 TaxID=3374623 RepID=UPI0037B21633